MLLEITNTIELDSEIEIRMQTAYMDLETKRKTRRQMKRDRLNERERVLNLGPNFDPMNISKRTTVWALTEAGPFRSYLHRYGLNEESECRFCYQEEETAVHLLHCEHFGFQTDSDSTTEQFEECFSIIINELYKTM